MQLDLDAFQKWACGNLAENRNRAVFAEWLVGLALGALNQSRMEWDSCDFRHGGLRVEVKAAGLSQTWKPASRSTPRFDIAQKKYEWNATTNQWKTHDTPQRNADVYVFCLHQSVPATNENVADLACWQFWVVATRTLNSQLDNQKSLGLTALNNLAKPIGWHNIKAAITNAN